ncbi:hypothetical protein [Planctomycetes bacterium TBK1r]|uniref:Uncharacterized protein n=1 Tax=Stieleria magnilauensis TaxID=2527963 RepID=A0ABX5Y208_9BACT|nr:hypothetical protein TBK1r_73400 [Planctomycetes bacterium TBK1r]
MLDSVTTMPKRFSHGFFTAPSRFPLLNFSAPLQADGETDVRRCSGKWGEKMGWSKNQARKQWFPTCFRRSNFHFLTNKFVDPPSTDED